MQVPIPKEDYTFIKGPCFINSMNCDPKYCHTICDCLGVYCGQDFPNRLKQLSCFHL